MARGGVLRCDIEDDEHGELVAAVDETKLILEEFGRLLRTYAGWGMRIEFTPDDAIHPRPVVEVREPNRS